MEEVEGCADDWRGYERTQVALCRSGEHQGSLAPEHSFLQVQPNNVIVTALKRADENSLVLRLYEWPAGG
jgi:alpha-mannosidase